MINSNELENEVAMIEHHIHDALKHFDDIGYVKKSLMDILEATSRLRSFLPDESVSELDRLSESINRIASSID